MFDYLFRGSPTTPNPGRAPALGFDYLNNVIYVSGTGGWVAISGGTGGTLIVGEPPSGPINGVNRTFFLANAPLGGTLALYQDGARLAGHGGDYNITSNVITFVVAPLMGDTLLADYLVSSGGGGGGGAPLETTGEVPSGAINSSNLTFTLANTPIVGSLALYQAGNRLSGGGADYSIIGSTITFIRAPRTGDTLLADYNH
jgi:hypothetical protein